MSMKKVLGCIRKADEDYNLIEENDKTLIKNQIDDGLLENSTFSLREGLFA